ncbi:menaquinone-dependent protoporphyrinogen IX dehydrogenase [Yersinia pekkanenii]|uniref:Protoporphyrinogen IX dehydrogenase [quinone] n=1 Tax=Yersinia pekkanenii TaxID=1288385 RepID=A0A0T9NQ08_9GAMM|nr:menaquinone-dependent protoporphyrinogen IX dehydrogenase [Yersinia pekkanenii]CNH23928.1 protoporphyrinogen oxidase [Yersinia pekkanenii]CRY67173.1 protoporphyrinogen oxidase [Yersinia pekkanenii]
MKVLILYSSRDGQTQTIASYIAKQLSAAVTCEIQDLSQVGQIDLSQYQQVMIGASVRYGHFNSVLSKFVNKHVEQLNQMPNAFFAVNLTARKPEKRSPQTNSYVRKFLLSTPWQPVLCTVFAGALRYPRYRWIDRVMIQLIMRMTGGETDTSKEVEYTDWQQVSSFAQDFLALQYKKQQ